ncbi:MAG: hypothetical protein GF398_03555 [Chitinivibrionales bacterium]|nr:hypothetical protein [Chitinivibrionales bacterium]
MKVALDTTHTTLVIKLIGSISAFRDAETFYKQVSEKVTDELENIILDFNECSLPDSRFISKILELYHVSRKKEITVNLMCDNNPDVFDIVKLAYLDKIMPLISSREEVTGS